MDENCVRRRMRRHYLPVGNPLECAAQPAQAHANNHMVGYKRALLTSNNMTKSRHSLRPSTPSIELSLRELRTEPGIYAYDGWKNVSIGVWVGQATLPAVQRLLEMCNEQERAHPDGRSSVVFVLDQLPGPLPEAQRAMAEVYSSEGLTCAAVILEGTGFWASGIRGMASNLLRTSSGTLALNVFTSIDEAVSWLPPIHQSRTGVALPADDFRRALAYVREKGAARARAAR